MVTTNDDISSPSSLFEVYGAATTDLQRHLGAKPIFCRPSSGWIQPKMTDQGSLVLQTNVPTKSYRSVVGLLYI